MNRRQVLSIIASIAVTTLSVHADTSQLGQLPNTWIKRSPLADTQPSPRLGYEGACVWDSPHRLLIRYGGHNQGGGGAQYSELWTFDLFTTKWTLKEPDTSPPGVCCAQQNVYDPIHRRYVRFPAFSGNHGWQWFREIYLNDSTIWVYDLDTNLWHNLCPVPAPQVSPLRCASWDRDSQVIVLFGGEGNREGTVVYDPQINKWTRMNPANEPPFRSGSNMVYDTALKLHILFGAQFSDDQHTWGYDLSKNQWCNLQPAILPPTNENDAVCAYDSLNKVVLAIVKITEGKDENAKHRLETWAYNTVTNVWTKMNPPQEPDSTGNRSRVLVYASDIGLSILENRTSSEPVPPEQQIWTYCFDYPKADFETLLLPPIEVQVTTTTNGAALTWKPNLSKGITHYLVYRGTGEHPWTVNYRQIASVDANQTRYCDSGLQRGIVYYYTVSAANNDRLSEPSIKVRTQPRIVEGAVVSVLSENEVHVEWIPPKASDIIGYYVERANVEVWTENQLKRLKSRVRPLPDPSVGAIRRISPFKRITPELIKQTSFRDSVDLTKPRPVEGTPVLEQGLSNEHLDHAGKMYRFAVFAYRIRAVNALGVESGSSPYFLTIPSAPRWVFAKEDGMTCQLKWAANPERSLRGYRIYRLDGRWDQDPILRITTDPIGDLTFSDPSAGNNSRRYYVVAIDALAQEGFPSAPVWYKREWKQFYDPFSGEWHQ